MRVIKISEEVWQAIASHGKFGETEDDVLRRILGLPANSGFNEGRTDSTSSTPLKMRAVPGKRRSFATLRMSSYINHNQLHVEFQNGESSFWPLPDPKEKAAIRTVLSKALEFASKQNASIGQLNAVRKTLTDGGYHLTK